MNSKFQAKFKLGFRLGFAFSFFILNTSVLVTLFLLDHGALHDLQRREAELAASLPAVHPVMEGVGASRDYVQQYLGTASADRLSPLDGLIAAKRVQALAALTNLRAPSLDAQDQENYTKTRQVTIEYFREQDKLLQLAREQPDAARREAATAPLSAELQQALSAVNTSVEVWAAHREALVADAVVQGDSVYRHTLWTVLAMSCWVLFSAVLSAVRITGSVLGPLRQAMKLTEEVAQGDLTRRSEVPGRDELCALLTALNNMASRLSTLVEGVVISAEAVRVTAGQLDHSNMELSQRTQTQAASLQETAVSMEEVTVLGKANSGNAARAAQLAEEARELAENSGIVVAAAVTAMSAINQGSVKIANIVSVIDEIAFQTNLLALNAAVEAARAGEQGRGFAVVASEVRALAQRSSGAAKEIKVLITDSADKVQAGTEMVDRSGQALIKILASVRQMTTLIKEIANSSHEQAVGIARINQVISHLDQGTQQNASLVKEGSEAASRLREQADALSERAAFFTIEQPAKRVIRNNPAVVEQAEMVTPIARSAIRKAS